MIEALGWTANFIFMISAAPQAYMSWRQGHSRGLSMGMVGLWCTGEFLALIYGVLVELPAPVMFNYCINLVFMLIILRYYFLPRGEK